MMTKTHLLRMAAVAGLLSSMIATSAHAYIVAQNGDIPSTMNAGGTWDDMAEYLVGLKGSYNLSFPTGVNAVVGDTTSYNLLSIEGMSTITSAAVVIGQTGNNNEVLIRSSSVWTATGGSFAVGAQGSGNSLTIMDGARVNFNSSSTATIGSGSLSDASQGNNNAVTVTGTNSSWTMTANFVVGLFGSRNYLVIEQGGQVSNVSGWIGWGIYSNSAQGSENDVTVVGRGSTWTNTANLTIGLTGSRNTLTILDHGLVVVDGNLGISTGGGLDNYLRIEDGYIALFGDRTAELGGLISDGKVQLWNGSAWVTWTNLSSYELAYYATNAAALDYSGYDNLGGYTILSAQTVPEPGTWAMIAAGLGGIYLLRRRA